MVWVFHALLLGSLAGDAAVDKSLWRADKQVSEKAVALSPKMSSVCLLPAKCGWLLERLREGVQVDHLCSHHQWCWLWLWPFSAKVSLTRGCRCFVWQSAVFERKKKNNPISTKMKNPTLALWVTLLLDVNIFKTFRSLLQWFLRMPRTTELKLFRLLFFFFFSSLLFVRLSRWRFILSFLEWTFRCWHLFAICLCVLMQTSREHMITCVCDEPLFWSYVGMRRGHCLLACQNFTKTQAGKNTHLFSRQFQWILSLFLRHAIVDLLW